MIKRHTDTPTIPGQLSPKLPVGLPDLRPPAWTGRASCADLPIEVSDSLFFSPGTLTNVAKKMCRECPANADCKSWAETQSIPHGVFAGEEGGRRRKRLGITVYAQPAGLVGDTAGGKAA